MATESAIKQGRSRKAQPPEAPDPGKARKARRDPDTGVRVGGPDTWEPTPEQREKVQELATAGIPRAQICLMIRKPDGKAICKDTLNRHFPDELEVGTIEANAAIAGSLYNNALGGNVGAQIFWLKTRARWQETPVQVAHTDPEGNPAKPLTLADFYGVMQGRVSPEQFASKQEQS